MRCQAAREMFSEYIDEELTQEQKGAFDLHLKECPSCKRELEELVKVHKLFASAERFEAPYGFATRVMAHLEEPEKGAFSRLKHFVLGRAFFLRVVEVAFAFVIMLIGIMSGNLLVTDRASAVQPNVQEAFSLDLFQATPPGSVGGTFVRLAGVADER